MKSRVNPSYVSVSAERDADNSDASPALVEVKNDRN
jgi:hypothetical protein